MIRLVRPLTTAALICAPVLLASPMPAAADPPEPITYREAVAGAYDVVTSASPGDVQAAHIASGVLREGTGVTQPEILADLARRPPDLGDAAIRLKALLDAIDDPAATSDPAAAQARLHDVLAMSRYDALRRPPSALARLLSWIDQRVQQLLRFLFGGNSVGGIAPTWLVYAIGVAGLAFVIFIVFRSARGRFGGYADLPMSGPRAPADFFADADRLAAKGDRVAALRALCAGVAGTLAGERTWEGSPLTVREIFSRAPDPVSLRPLLQPFEAAVYGGRGVDAATYERALAAAEPYRRPMEKAA